MENSPRYRDDAQSLLPSPSSSSSSSSITTPTRTIITISGSTTYVQTDPSSFKQVVQMLTGSSKKPNFPNPTHQRDPRYSLPPVRPVPNKKQSSSSSSSGFRFYERRNSKKDLKINPVHSGLPDKLSLSILDFPSPVLSLDTPLVPDPFYRSGSINLSPTDSGFGHYDPKRSSDVEEREIREKGFYLLPSPSSTPTDPEPRLLPLFPLTSPRASKSLADSTKAHES